MIHLRPMAMDNHLDIPWGCLCPLLAREPVLKLRALALLRWLSRQVTPLHSLLHTTPNLNRTRLHRKEQMLRFHEILHRKGSIRGQLMLLVRTDIQEERGHLARPPLLPRVQTGARSQGEGERRLPLLQENPIVIEEEAHPALRLPVMTDPLDGNLVEVHRIAPQRPLDLLLLPLLPQIMVAVVEVVIEGAGEKEDKTRNPDLAPKVSKVSVSWISRNRTFIRWNLMIGWFYST